MGLTKSSVKPAAQRLARMGACLCAAMLLSYLESILPLSAVIPLPGVKLGLCNLVIFLCAAFLSLRDAGAVSLCRTLLTALLFGTAASFFFSLCGALFSFLILLLTRRAWFVRLSAVSVCTLSAAFHAIGQLAAAAVLFSPEMSLSYAPFLIAACIPCGALCGIAATLLLRCFPRRGTSPEVL